MAPIEFIDEGIKARKVLVVSSNMICVREICRIAEDGIAESISSKSEVPKGVLMHISHFASEDDVAKVLRKVEEAVKRTDDKASIKAMNCAAPVQPP